MESRAWNLLGTYVDGFDFSLMPEVGEAFDAEFRGWFIQSTYIRVCEARGDPKKLRYIRKKIELDGIDASHSVTNLSTGEACFEAARTLATLSHPESDFTSNPPTFPKRDTLAFRYAAVSCVYGYASGCRMAGSMLEHGYGVTKDTDKGRAVFGLACDLGNDGSCNLQRAQKACESGEWDLCVELADYYRGSDAGVEEDDILARSLYQRACDQHRVQACIFAGLMDLNGEGGPENLPRALTLLSGACDSREAFDGQGFACGAAAQAACSVPGPITNSNVRVTTALRYLGKIRDLGEYDLCLQASGFCGMQTLREGGALPAGFKDAYSNMLKSCESLKAKGQ